MARTARVLAAGVGAAVAAEATLVHLGRTFDSMLRGVRARAERLHRHAAHRGLVPTD
jgi:hypothetical protein